MSQTAVITRRRIIGRAILVLPLMLAIAGCAGMSWKHPSTWNPFHKKPAPPPELVEVLSIESGTPGSGDRFTQSWDGVRLVVDVFSGGSGGRATLKPRDQGWPLKLAFRMHVTALEGFEAHGAQNMRISLGANPLLEPAYIDLPYGVYNKETAQLNIQWIDHYR